MWSSSAHHIYEREEYDPDEIHHVPVCRAALEAIGVLGAVAALAGLHPEYAEDHHAGITCMKWKKVSDR